MNLLYRATLNGGTSDNFYNKVNDINSTLTIIKTKKAIRFGLFFHIPVKKNTCQNKDQKLF